MKKFFVFLAGMILCFSAYSVPVRVRYIIDGDTFVADVLLNQDTEIESVSVRLDNVDTPELHGKCDYEIERAEYAKQRLSELIPVGSIIEIKNIKNDKYPGRIDASVFDSLNRNIGQILINEKIGRPYSGGKRKPWCY